MASLMDFTVDQAQCLVDPHDKLGNTIRRYKKQSGFTFSMLLA